MTKGALLFLMTRTFRGGDGHVNDSKSLFELAMNVSEALKSGGRRTLIPGYYPVWETLYV